VIDPAPRYLPADVYTDDTLYVGDQRIEGENPRAAQLRAVVAAGGPVSATGARWVLVQHDGAPVPAGLLAGLARRYAGSSLDLYLVADPAAPAPPGTARRVLVVVVDLLAGGLVIAAFWCLRRRATAW
jgi:hypothetical protein